MPVVERLIAASNTGTKSTVLSISADIKSHKSINEMLRDRNMKERTTIICIKLQSEDIRKTHWRSR